MQLYQLCIQDSKITRHPLSFSWIPLFGNPRFIYRIFHPSPLCCRFLETHFPTMLFLDYFQRLMTMSRSGPIPWTWFDHMSLIFKRRFSPELLTWERSKAVNLRWNLLSYCWIGNSKTYSCYWFTNPPSIFSRIYA